MRKCEGKARHIFNENSLTAQLLAVIGTGEKAAVTSKQIKQSFGLTERELRKIVERCRRNGIYPILGRIPPLLSEAKVGDECRLFFTETIDNQ